MILLETNNFLLEETLSKRFSAEKREDLNIKLVDFDSVTFHISTPEGNRDEIIVSIRWGCFKELVNYGASELLNEIYSAPFERAFEQQISGKTSEPMIVHYREDEMIFIQAHSDRVTVIFSTFFKEEMDQVFGKVFLQEFVDARRDPSVQNAPQVLYTNREPPLEIRDIPGVQSHDNIGYVTFVLNNRHYKDEESREKTISMIQTFRDYLHYHIKCSKAYMHSRMRARVSDFLKVLNRARPENKKIEKKTA
ncbi:Arp complex subunit, partial [Massospora cicadina]